MTHQNSAARRPGRAAAAGIGTAGLLVLTSCGGDEEPPPLEDIAENILESVEQAESFTVLSDGDWDAAFASEPMFDDVDAEAEDQEVLVHFTEGGDRVSMHAHVLDMEWEMLFLRPEGTAYMPVSAFIDLMELGAEAEGDDISSFIDAEGFREEAGDRWLIIEDMTASDMEEIEVSSLLDQYGFDDASSVTDQYASEGELQERDGTSVWVYPGEEEAEQLVVLADAEEPYLVELSHYDDDDNEVTDHYSNWNEAPEAEEPAEDELMTEQELEELLMSHIVF